MKLRVLQENLSSALNITSRFASSRAQLPVLANVLLSAKKSKLLVSSTNLEISVSISIGAKVDKVGELTIPARVLNDLVSNLAPGSVSLQSEKEHLKISSQNFSSRISGMNSSDFPKIPHETGKGSMSLAKNKFVDALSKVLFAASIDETRPVLTGVLFIFKKEKIILVATDGFRLSKKELPLNRMKAAFRDQRLILPKSALSELARLSNEEEDLRFSYKETESQVVFGVNNTILASRVIEGEFPDFEKIIPKESVYRISLDKEDLLRAVKLSAVFARDSANVVKMLVNKDSLALSAESAQSGEQEALVDAKIEGGKPGLKIAFNYRFLEELLSTVRDNDIQIELSDAGSPGVFTTPKDKNFLHLIMPVRIQD